MDFKTYQQNNILNSNQLIDFILNTICDNLEYLFGPQMRTEESKNEWIDYNLKKNNPNWYCVIGYDNKTPCGLLIYTYDSINEKITVNDIEISKLYRHNIVLIRGLFKEALLKNDFNTIRGYINKNNFESQSNFLKFATIVNETKNGYIIETNSKSKDRILSLLKNK